MIKNIKLITIAISSGLAKAKNLAAAIEGQTPAYYAYKLTDTSF